VGEQVSLDVEQSFRRGMVEGVDWSRARAEHRARQARAAILSELAPLGGSTQTVYATPLSHRQTGCVEACRLADGICRSASVICEIAEQYPGLGGVEGDCVWATVECEGARRLCRGCRGE
jgi:hypothetical protein